MGCAAGTTSTPARPRRPNERSKFARKEIQVQIAVTGATGQLGRLVIEKLKQLVQPSRIIALARTPAKAADLGITVREAIYDQPETLAKAFAGVDRLLLISSSEVGQRVPQHRNVIEAAKAANVGQVVYTSLLHADVSPLSLANEHLATESLLFASGLPFAVLRNGWYSENYQGPIIAALNSGALIGSAQDGKISAAARRDFAEAAAVVLTSDGHAGKTYELAGDEAFTLSELAAEISRQSGRDIPYQDLPESEYATALRRSGMPEAVATMLAGAHVAVAKGALFNDERQLSALIGHGTIPITAIVSQALN